MGSLHPIAPLGASPPTSSSPAAVSSQDPLVGRIETAHSSAYTIEKFLALDTYMASSSPWRVAAVVMVVPLPGLIGALLPVLIPLQDPLLGIRANPGYLQCGFTISIVSALGTLWHWRAGAGISSQQFTGLQVIGVALVASLVQYSFGVLLVFLWRFPAPMSWLVVSLVNNMSYTIAFLAIFRRRCKQDTELMASIKKYVPALTVQSVQIVLYSGFSILFDKVSAIYQVILTLVFPFIKYLMKKWLRKQTLELNDFSNEIAVTGIEICASLYQSMILQNTPSQAALVVIMAVDVIQGLVTVKFFMDRPSHVPQNQIVYEALKQLKSPKPDSSAHLAKLCWIGEPPTAAVPGNSVVPSPERITPGQREPRENSALFHDDTQPPAAMSNVNRKASTNHTSSVIIDALHLISVAESILLVEYLEVAIPLINAVFVAVACHFNGAQYNTRLRKLYFHPEALASAVQSIVLYSLLQALSFVAMHLVMRHRYGLSAMYQLAFVLERHWYSIVGKMVGWLPVILHFTVIHFGVDFSFRFDFAAMLRGDDGP